MSACLQRFSPRVALFSPCYTFVPLRALILSLHLPMMCGRTQLRSVDFTLQVVHQRHFPNFVRPLSIIMYTHRSLASRSSQTGGGTRQQ